MQSVLEKTRNLGGQQRKCPGTEVLAEPTPLMGVWKLVEILLLPMCLGGTSNKQAEPLLRINPTEKGGSTSFQLPHQTSIIVKNLIIMI